jgi:hypothetical protein
VKVNQAKSLTAKIVSVLTERRNYHTWRDRRPINPKPIQEETMKKFLLAAAAVAVMLSVALPARAEDEAKPDKPKSHEFTGKITKIDGMSVTVKKKEEEKVFSAVEKVKVVVPGKEAGELSDLKVGDKVTVTFTEADGKNVASKFQHAETKPKKEKKAEPASTQ